MINEAFLTACAWIFGVGATSLVVMRILGGLCYSELDRIKDRLEGRKVTFPILVPSIIAIVCWIWIYTN